MHPTATRPPRGFTALELLIVVTIVAVLLTVTIPSFRGFLAKKRVEGVASELTTDLQFARSAAVARNTEVRLTFVTASCYVIHLSTLNLTALTACPPTANAALLKVVELQAGTNASFSGAPAFVEFDPVRGMAVTDTANTGASIDTVSSAGAWQLRNTVTLLGKVNLCSPGGSVGGYASC
jgi:type IV fimbrial biogenesis protein FimT